MQNKIKLFGLLFGIFTLCVMPVMSYADDDFEELVDEEDDSFDFLADDAANDLSAMSVASYDVDGSVFQKITDLEQQKVLMELEKERAQLDLDLDRLAAEKIKLQMEMDTLSGRAEQEQQILQNEKAKLEAEAARIEAEKKALIAAAENETYAAPVVTGSAKKASVAKKKPVVEENQDEDWVDISSLYKLVNVMGAGNQLQATLSDLETGQTKRVTVGKKINGFVVKSISLEDGVVFSKDGETQNLNISSR
jgi:type IV pilus biogenesis protein PilP